MEIGKGLQRFWKRLLQGAACFVHLFFGHFLSTSRPRDHKELNVVPLCLCQLSSQEADYLDQWHPFPARKERDRGEGEGKGPKFRYIGVPNKEICVCFLQCEITSLLWAWDKQQRQQIALHRSSWKHDPPLQFRRATVVWQWLSAESCNTKLNSAMWDLTLTDMVSLDTTISLWLLLWPWHPHVLCSCTGWAGTGRWLPVNGRWCYSRDL